MASEDYGVDFESEVALVVGDVRAGCTREEAAEAIRLVLLVNDVSLRNLMPSEVAKGFGFFQSKPSSAFSPVAGTPGELGAAWDGGKTKLPLVVTLNGKPFGRPDAGVDMAFDFPKLIVHAARTRPLGAGTIAGSGTVSNKGSDGGPGRPIDEGGAGSACTAELRAVETILEGKPKTPYLKFGVVRIETKDAGGRSIFGAVEQSLERYAPRTRTRRRALALLLPAPSNVGGRGKGNLQSMTWLWVMLGSALGGVARYWLSGLAPLYRPDLSDRHAHRQRHRVLLNRLLRHPDGARRTNLRRHGRSAVRDDRNLRRIHDLLLVRPADA
jgi:2-keto-4-pentenoate hydratase/2-oxohepta-3-ene-1,7-dioic acid hydratase in catechol pathway